MWLMCSVLLLFAFFANNVEAQGGKCDMPGESDWNTALRWEVTDKDVGIDKKYTTANIKDVKFDFKYVNFKLDANLESLTLTLTDDFKNYVENEEATQIDTQLSFTCTDGSTVSKSFNLKVTQMDFSKPEILGSDPFDFHLIMPILPHTLIPEVQIKVSEKNLDTEPNDISFLVLGSCGDNFEFGKNEKDGVKAFKATLKSKDKIIKLDKPVTCDIQVKTDHGDDSAIMNLNVDVKESVPPNPQFEEALYTAIVNTNNKIDPIKIKLLNEIFVPSITWNSDVYKDHFDFDTKTMTFSSTKSLPADAFDSRIFITVKIEATYDKAEGPGRTVIIISPKDTGIREVPEFVKPLYVAQYENPNKITVEDIHLKSIQRDAHFDIHSEDGYKNYFHFETNKLTIENLPESVFKDKNSISITIEATYKTVPISDKTVVIVNGPEKIVVSKPVFEKPLYETRYEDENTITIEDILLEPTEIPYAVKFDVVADKKEYFKFENNKFTIHNLPESEFDGRSYISVKIVATYEHKGVENSGETAVIINAPEKIDIPVPVFTKDLYEAQYIDENNIQIDDILLEPADTKYTVSFDVIYDKKDFFKFENNKLTIHNLPESEFDDKNYISVKIVATYEHKGVKTSGGTVVIINPPKKIELPVLVFEKQLYQAQYEDENTLDVEKIILQSVDKNKIVLFDVISEHKQYFDFQNNVLTISGLPKTVFDEKNFILITIEAKYEDTDISGKTTVLINGPKDTKIQELVFEKSLYEAQYLNENELTVEDIKLESADPNKKVEFKVISEHETFFKFKDNKLAINGLPTTIFNEKNYILITIEANYLGEQISGKTSVLINGPKQIDEDSIPVFVKPFYEAQYQNENKLTVEDIKLVSDDPSKKVEFKVVSEHDKYFTFDNNKLTIQNLPATVFDNNYILVTIEAKYEGGKNSGKTTVLINGPTQIEIPTAVFEKSSYEAQYINENKIEVDDITLKPTGVTYKVKFEIISDLDKKYFNFDTNKLSIRDLPVTVFDTNSFISITIQAKYEGALSSGETVVIINGPETNEIPTAVFEKSLYEAKYQSPTAIEHDDILLKPAGKPYAVEYKIISAYEKHFDFDPATHKLIVIDPLSEDIFDDKNFISVTIQATYKDALSSGYTVVIINAPDTLVPVPEFEKSLYEAQYKDKDTIQVDKIKLKSVSPGKDVSYKIVSDIDIKYFSFDNEELKIHDLTTTVFDGKHFISIKIQATYKEATNSGETVVIINGPDSNDIPTAVFEKSLYEAQYINENKLEVDDINLKPTGGTYKAKFEIISDLDKKYFNFDTNKLSIKDLPVTVFDSNSFISITIQAKYEGALSSGETVVIINGPETNEIPTAVFEKSSYEAQYINENKLEVDDINLKPTGGTYKAKFEIISDLDKKYFNFDTNKLSIKDLPVTVFDTNSFISITIQAKYEGALSSGETVVIINGPETNEIPTAVFEKSSYEAQYINENKLEVDDINLKPTGGTYKAKFEIISDLDKKYFNFDTNKLSIKDLPVTVFDTNSFISITIQAKYEGALNSGETVVIINGPETNEIPTAVFEKSSYEAKYQSPTAIEHDDILLKPAGKPYAVEYKIISAFEKHFDFDPDTHKLIVTDPLSEDIFDDKNFISVTIQATYKDASSSGYTVVIINAPDALVPEFEKSLYEAQYKDKDTIQVDKIKLKSVSPGKDVSYKIISDIDIKYFSFDNEELKIHDLPTTVFDGKHFISIKIQATYKEATNSGETVVIINGPETNEIPTAVFEKSSYEAQYINENKLEVDDINLKPTGGTYKAKFEIISDLDKKYFNFDTNKLSIKDLPVTVFDTNSFISITIQAKYEGALSSGETVVIINGPETNEIPTAVFEKSSYEAKYKSPTAIEHDDILLKPAGKPYAVEYKIISAYEKHFAFDPDTHKLIVTDPLSEDIFDDKNFISVTIQATYKDASSSGYTVVIINSPKTSGTQNKIYFDKQADVLVKDSPITGFVGIYLAVSDDDEKLNYSVEKSGISSLFEYKNDGILNVIGNLPAQPYYQITLAAEGEKSKSVAKMDVILIDKKETNIAGFKFDNRLEVHNVLENSKPTIIVPMLQNHVYKIVDNSEGWFKIDNGNLVLNTIDREDPKLKDMLVAQVKTKIQAEEKTKLTTPFNRLQYGLKQLRNQDSCLDISNIPNSYKEMDVVVTIEDVNDHGPVFNEVNPLTIGYPSSEIAEYVAPPYLVKVGATDEDIGLNAKLRYSVDKNFKIDPENGIIYPSEDLSTDTEFSVTATDRDGADDGRSSTLKIKVKLLKEEHITVITANDIAYNEIDKFVENLSKETKTKVKYLSSTALPKTDTKNLKLTRADDKIPVLRIVMYAFDNDEIVPSPDFKKKIEGSSLSESVKVSEYESPETLAAKDKEESSDSGWIAAVSTLSVLLGLMIIGVVAVYIFYLRPKFFGGPIKYEKQVDNDSIHMAPVELKMESSRTIDRRPTGFPVGFNPTDLDDEDEDDDDVFETVKEELPTEEIDEGINDSVVSSTNESDRRKSVVKFDINVTEIEISEL